MASFPKDLKTYNCSLEKIKIKLLFTALFRVSRKRVGAFF